jgi:DHA1 family tetracycline resistance protein-like MFS transporter
VKGQRSPLLVIFLVVFIDLLGFGLILPLLPFYAESLGASEVQIGILLVAFAAMQFIGAPILGSLSDRFGRRPLLIVSQVGTVIAFLMLGAADSWAMLLLSRMVGGLMGGNITVAQAYISDITDEANRAQGLALIGAAFGLGFILGPVAGGWLAAFGFAVPAYAAAGVALLTVIFTIVAVPEPPQRIASGRGGPLQALRNVFVVGARPQLRQIYLTVFLSALGLIAFQSCFALFAERRFGFGPRETGLLLAYVGVITVILQVGFTGKLVKRFGEQRLVFVGAILLGLSLLTTALAPTWPVLLFSFLLIALGPGLLNPSLQSLLTLTSGPAERGQVLGVFTSVDSLARMIAPLPATWLLGAVSPGAPLLLGAVLAAFATLTAMQIIQPAPTLETEATHKPA